MPLPDAGSAPVVVRFRYETGHKGGWVRVLADSALSPGRLATQNAGSSNPGIYYQFGGGGLNGAFGEQLGDQFQPANDALRAAYDTRFGTGAFARDSAYAAAPPPGFAPPLTSLLAPLVPGAGTVGTNVVAAVYSVGPRLTDGQIVDEAMYARIYIDAFQTIADWNRAHPASHISNFRATLVSTNLYAGANPTPTLRNHAAKLVITAAAEALHTNPELAGLVVLVNTNDSGPDAGDGAERLAFHSAATALGLPQQPDGFEVPITT